MPTTQGRRNTSRYLKTLKKTFNAYLFMKKTYWILALALGLLSFTVVEHPFDQVIALQTDDSTKAKLRTFREEGIEQPLIFVSNDSVVTDTTPNIDLEKAIKTAQSFLGTKHVLAGTTKDGIDCSGLVMMSLKSTGVELPHNSHGQARFGRIIPLIDSLKRGDLVFFIHSFKSEFFITHSGIYLGNKRFIHASASKGVTTNSIIEPYWKPKFIFGTRIKG